MCVKMTKVKPLSNLPEAALNSEWKNKLFLTKAEFALVQLIGDKCYLEVRHWSPFLFSGRAFYIASHQTVSK